MNSRDERGRTYEKVSADRTREELIYAVLSLPVECDPRVRTLVETLNDLPDIYTCSSCGGHHDNVGRENPAPEGCFYLQFIVEPTEAGFLSLGIIDLAARNVDCERLAVQVLNTTDSPRLVMFHMLAVHHSYGVPGASRRRAFSLRFLGDDMTHAPRHWRTSPPFPGLEDELPAGAPMDHPLFPLLRSPS